MFAPSNARTPEAFDEPSAIEPPLDVAQQQSLQGFKSRLDAVMARNARVFLALVMLGALAQIASTLSETSLPWPARVSRIGTSSAVLLICLCSLAFAMRWGARVAAAFFSSALLLVLFGAAAWYGNGVRSSGMSGVLALVVVLGMMVGTKAAVRGTLAAVLGYFTLWLLERIGVLPGLNASNTPPLASYAVVFSVSAGLIGWLVLRYGTLFWEVTHSLEGSRRLLADTVRAQQKVAHELRESEERLRMLLDSSLTSIQILEGDSGALRFANAQTLEKYGCERAADLDTALMHPGGLYSKAALMVWVQRTLKEGPQYFEWQSRRRDGEPIWWDMKMDRMQLAGQACVVLFGHDITARVRAEAELRVQQGRLEDDVRLRTAELQAEKQRMQDILEALPITLSIRDTAGHYTLVNRAFELASGFSREQVLGRTPAGLFSPEVAAEIAESDAQLLAGSLSLSSERQIQHPKDGPHDYLLTMVALVDARKQHYGILNLGTDVTSLKRLQRELSLAKDEAERLARAKSDFLANMSHEIRTPLNAVLGLAQLGVSRSTDPLASRNGFERIVRSGRHLLGVINDILDYSKVESGKLDIESLPCNLVHLAKEVIDLVSERADAKNLRLRMEYKCSFDWVALDSLRVTQILVNLLANAIKFTDKGRVTLALEAQQDWLRLSVTDTGLGIAPEQQARIFRAFEQADSSTTRQFGGTGLGLSISSQLARAMGGEIEVDSVLGQGSCFTLRLPLQRVDPALLPVGATVPAARLGEPAATAGASLQGLRLLITDDVDINREILHDMLTVAGAEVLSADSGAQAIARLREAGPTGIDLVLMDVQMPDMDGYEATRRLHLLAPQLPVVALTAHALAEERQRCLAAGMVAHISKPIDQAELIRTLLSLTAELPRRGAASAPGGEPPPVTVAVMSPAAPLAVSAWPALPGTDFDAALARCAGRQELLAKLLGTFAKQYAQHQSLFEEARITGLAALGSAAHRLKGLAGNLGLVRLAELAAALEQATGPRGEPAQLPEAMLALNRELGPLVAGIQAWRQMNGHLPG
ncbi:response regulator [Paucibacter sp. DJ1R-11]|uniref:ATP-binding protein n=1 Tax=Paucibacter sp. DJ1R-11 TaxID=2893556 RepID=UPI0021E4D4B9|nr:ATP-binding protein [Paucibacter sp. DJ1R-11]MCV2362630.1 response regulator [Paucibacter sp. DJ1R-11]